MNYFRISLILLLILSSDLIAKERYKWYKGEKKFFEEREEIKYIVFQDVQSEIELSQILNNQWEIENFNNYNIESLELNRDYLAHSNSKHAIIRKVDFNLSSKLPENKKIIYESNFISNINGDEIGISNLIYVKLKSEFDMDLLKDVVSEFNIQIVGKDPLMSKWYILECTKFSHGIDAMDIANKIYESQFFEYASPSLIPTKSQATCTNEPYISWSLINTGYLGGTPDVDTDICEAWAITKGDPTIKVAVIDHGVEKNHPDLPNVLNGFDAMTNSTPSVIHGNHGTPCAGIIAAKENNAEGVAGIAPNVKILPISHTLYDALQAPGIEQQYALAINWAWQNGADVISNSWASLTLENEIIDVAINNALTQGRNGLGCVVVFASGNDGLPSVNYPANSNPKILAVGGVDRCGIRSGRSDILPNSCDPWPPGSQPAAQFGTELDVVGPGTSVITTDREAPNGYETSSDYVSFAGTSAATPFVAGVAALILSVDNCLTVEEVNDIIESTAKKVGGYLYGNKPGRNNGSWHNVTGYGFANAAGAVHLALNQYYRQNSTETSVTKVYANHQGPVWAGKDVINPDYLGIGIGDYTVSSSANIRFKSTQEIRLEPGFVAEDGSEFYATIESFNGDCDVWNSSMRVGRNTAFDLENQIIENKVNTIESNISIYPNPFSNSFTVEIKLEDRLKTEYLNTMSLTLFNSHGKIILSNSVDMENEIIFEQVVPEGDYGFLICKICINNECEVFKLIKSN